MLMKATVWTLSVIISLCVESSHSAQKLKIHWGPQSMMYLKGKHGRRFVSEIENNVVRQDLPSLYSVLKGIQQLPSQQLSKLRHILSADKVLIHYLKER